MKRILIVESDPALRDLYESSLSADGYEVLTACDEADALALNLVGKPDVIIMDPIEGRCGVEVAAEFARANKRVHVIFNTRNSYRMERDFSVWVADAIAEKGANADSLRSALRSVAREEDRDESGSAPDRPGSQGRW